MKPGGKRPSPPPLPPAPEASSPARDAAILKLLGDEDASVVKLVLQQLLADQNRQAAQARLEGLLREAAAAGAAPAAGELRHALDTLRRDEAAAALRARCARLRSLDDLEAFCWEAARYHDPEADLAAARARLDAWGEAVAEQIAPGASDLERIEALRLVLVEEGGLRGNADDYYVPANSFLDKVIATGLGIPISLSAVYLLVGARAGIEVEPIGMPGHFLIRIGTHYIDPFHEGLSVGEEALRELLERSGAPMEEAEAAWRGPLPLRLMAHRMAANLVHLYGQAGDAEGEARWEEVLGWLEAPEG